MRKVLAAFAAMSLASAMAVTQVGAGTAPPLTINPTEGDPGDPIAAQVDPGLVDTNCYTDVSDVQAATGPERDAWAGFAGWGGPPPAPTNYEELAEIIGFQTLDAIANNTDGAAEQLLPNTFILSFADIGTGTPLAIAFYDGSTGEGQIDVPDADPGLYAIAATCVFPDVTQESFDAAVAAAAQHLQDEYGDFPAGAAPDNAATAGPVIIEVLMAQQEGAGPWTESFTIAAALPELDPQTEAFCAVLVEFATVEATISEALAEIPEDDGTRSNQEWADDFDWDSINATLAAMGEEVGGLLAEGDEARVAEVADEWATVTEQIRDLLNALDAVDYDLSTPTGRQIANQLTAGADEESEPDPAVEAATETLTDFALTTCFPADPTAAPTAAPATPTAAQPSFTG